MDSSVGAALGEPRLCKSKGELENLLIDPPAMMPPRSLVLVRGPWSLVRGPAWSRARLGPWSWSHGPWSWSLVLVPWSVVPGPWSMVHGPGPWSLVHGPWSLAHGPWSQVHDTGGPSEERVFHE